MGWLKYCYEIPGLATRRFQELNGIKGRCVTGIGRAETDSQQWNTVKAGAFLQHASARSRKPPEELSVFIDDSSFYVSDPTISHKETGLDR